MEEIVQEFIVRLPLQLTFSLPLQFFEGVDRSLRRVCFRAWKSASVPIMKVVTSLLPRKEAANQPRKLFLDGFVSPRAWFLSS